MSGIADLSAAFEIPTPLQSSTLKLNSNENDSRSASGREAIQQKELMNNMKNSEPKTKFIKMKNNRNLKFKDFNDCLETSEYRDENDNKPMKLKVVVSNINVVNDLSKVQSPVVEKNSIEFVTSAKEPTPNKTYQKRPIMGRNALLRKANIEPNDSLIIYDLITEKYNGALVHYFDRAAQRRRLKIDSPESYYSDTVFSSPPGYSPLSVSSISTPSSMAPDEKNGFYFPNVNELSEKREFGYVTATDRVSIVPEEKDEDSQPKDGSSRKNYLRFITSTDDTNVETTDEDVEESESLTNSAYNEKSTTSFSDYDPGKFLDNALGEITDLDLSAAYDPNDICNDKKEKKDYSGDGSVGTSNLSMLLSKASSFCTSAKESIKRRCSFSYTSHPEDHQKDNRMSFHSDNIILDHLMRQLSLQNEIMFQVSKALNYCRTTKKFEYSTELLEAEKILLVASCTKEALTEEIQNVEDKTYEKKDDSKSCGEVQLSNFMFHPKDDHKTDTHRDFTEHFVVILTCGSTVLSSDVVIAEEKGVVNVKRSFSFTNLAGDFEISVCIYAMRVGNKLHQNHGQKTNCPSPKKILFHLKKGSRKYKVLSDVVYIRPSSFTLWGKCEIRSPDLSKTKPHNSTNVLSLKMHNTPLSSSLSGIFCVNIDTVVKLTNKMNGFLTIGTDNEHGCTIWNRRWCLLEGSALKYWNYPSEEVCNPLGAIDLTCCLEQRVGFADRSICARPRTLMLPIQHKEVVKKYLLSADSCSNMEKWEREINSIIRSLRIWNCINI